MTMVTIPAGGMMYPRRPPPWLQMSGIADLPSMNAGYSPQTIDAANDSVALIGYVYIDGRPASAKTLSAAGGGKMYFAASSRTFANAGTTFRFGVQDLSAVAANIPPPQPDGTFDVYGDLVGGTGTINTTSFTEVAMTSGSKSISHGQKVAIMATLTSRGGTDTITFQGSLANSGSGYPPINPVAVGQSAGGAWTSPGQWFPCFWILFDDGTVGWIADTINFHASQSFGDYITSTSTPDEYGLIFQVPFDCKVDALLTAIGYTSGSDNSGASLILYSDPLGTPSALVTATIDPLQVLNTQTNAFPQTVPLSSEITLSKNTDYCLAVQVTSSGTVRIGYAGFASDNEMKASGWWDPAYHSLGTRTNGTGAFTETVRKGFPAWVRISQIDDGSGYPRPFVGAGIGMGG